MRAISRLTLLGLLLATQVAFAQGGVQRDRVGTLRKLHDQIGGSRGQRKAWGDELRRAIRGADVVTMTALTSALGSRSRAISQVSINGARTLKVQDGSNVFEIANGRITRSTTSANEIVGVRIGSIGGGGRIRVTQTVGDVGPGQSFVGLQIDSL